MSRSANGDYVVPTALLRQLYLPQVSPARPAIRRPGSSDGDEEGSRLSVSSPNPVVHPRVVLEPLKGHRAGSASLDWARDADGLPVPVRPLIFSPTSSFPPVRLLGSHDKKRILVTGGAGFVGSHLVDRLMLLGHEVVVIDSYVTGSKTSIAHWLGHPNFELVRHDVTAAYMVEVDQIYHLACPASPRAYQTNAIKTMKTNFLGTLNMLGLAKRVKARFLLASTSEVYGSPDPAHHPQSESYWGNTSCTGPRACYDEGKRAAEALATEYHRQEGVDVRIARVFNTFGPRMSPNDGRVVSQFIIQALRGEDLTVYGDGSQTRSLCYIQDLVDGLVLLMNSDVGPGPVNLGNEGEATIAEWANLIIDTVDGVLAEGKAVPRPRSDLRYCPLPQDDPPRRRPDCTRARELFGWTPRFSVRDGIAETTRYLLGRGVLDEV